MMIAGRAQRYPYWAIANDLPTRALRAVKGTWLEAVVMALWDRVALLANRSYEFFNYSNVLLVLFPPCVELRPVLLHGLVCIGRTREHL